MKNMAKGITKVAILGLLFFCSVEQAFAAGASVSTMGSRGTVTPTATMYGGFTLDTATVIMIAVRGPSLQTLGATNNPLTPPSLRLFNSLGQDLLTNTTGGAGVSGCLSTHSTAIYYATVRQQALNSNDSCALISLAAGSYTFTITPFLPNTSGEVLFEVTYNPPTVSFSAQIQPIFNANCTSCHSPGGIGPFDITVGKAYASLVPQRVIAGNSAGSLLYKKISGTTAGSQMPLGGTPLSAADQTLIKNWIDQGAANN